MRRTLSLLLLATLTGPALHAEEPSLWKRFTSLWNPPTYSPPPQKGAEPVLTPRWELPAPGESTRSEYDYRTQSTYTLRAPRHEGGDYEIDSFDLRDGTLTFETLSPTTGISNGFNTRGEIFSTNQESGWHMNYTTGKSCFVGIDC